MSNPSEYEEALVAPIIKRICKGARRRWVPLQTELALRQQAAAESHARIEKEKAKWLDNDKIPR